VKALKGSEKFVPNLAEKLIETKVQKWKPDKSRKSLKHNDNSMKGLDNIVPVIAVEEVEICTKDKLAMKIDNVVKSQNDLVSSYKAKIEKADSIGDLGRAEQLRIELNSFERTDCFLAAVRLHKDDNQIESSFGLVDAIADQTTTAKCKFIIIVVNAVSVDLTNSKFVIIRSRLF
jgi:hypothetical protein